MFPRCAFSLQDEHSSEVILHVQNGQADIGFIVGQSNAGDLVETLAFSDRIYLIANSNAAIPEIEGLQDIGKLPLLMLNSHFSSYRLVYEYLKRAGCSSALNISSSLNSTEAIKSAVSAGYGMAFLPYMAVKKELYTKEFKIVEIPGFDLNYDVYSVYRAESEDRSESINEIIRYLVTTVNKNIC